jgi:hypothetical protein
MDSEMGELEVKELMAEWNKWRWLPRDRNRTSGSGITATLPHIPSQLSLSQGR